MLTSHPKEVATMDMQKELIAEYEREIALTRKLLQAIPADVDFAYKPHEKSMSLGRLAGHIAETAGLWTISSLSMDKLAFPADHKFEGYVPASTTALLERFDKETAEAKAILADFAAEKWDTHWSFEVGDMKYIDDTKYRVFRDWDMNHQIHHRAQLGVYLRILGVALPGIYGPSADGM